MVDKSTKSVEVLEFTHDEARKFFLKHESYCSLDLPLYINFSKMLSDINVKLDEEIPNKNNYVFSFQKDNHPLTNYNDINHIIITNKDGAYSWRPIELIHPFLYVSLVKIITTEKFWGEIKERFSEFSSINNIECMSRPRESRSSQRDKAEQIYFWWENIEQRSIELALQYDYLIHMDIADCYSSIYTHTIAWALMGKRKAKENRKLKDNVGNIIDRCIQNFSHGQTNGIPQGSVLMDFIAEMIFGYADMELSKKIKKYKITEDSYYIIRYRDDYRIFFNNSRDGENIAKLLNEVMIDLGLKFNASKTKMTGKVIKFSMKEDKLFWIKNGKNYQSLQKQLILIHDFAASFPNSGALIKELSKYRNKLESLLNSNKINTTDMLPLISIVTDIAYHNSKSYLNISAILSLMINTYKDLNKQNEVLTLILNKFKKIPNSGILDIWLQRLVLPLGHKDLNEFQEPLCRAINGQAGIWNNSWLKDEFVSFVSTNSFVDDNKRNTLSKVIREDEVALFNLFEY